MARKTKKNNLTNQELLSKVNSENLRLKQDFLDYLNSLQRSQGTIYNYSNDLDIFFVYCLQRLGNKKFSEVTKRDLISFQNWLIHENKNSPARVCRIKSTLSSLSNYIESILDDEPEYKNFKPIIKRIESPVKQPVREKTVFSDEELDSLLDVLTEKGQYEKACAVALAMCSGRRKSELVRFKVSDFKDENLICGGALYKTSEKIKTKGFGLGKYIYCYTLAKKFKPYFDRWLDYRKEQGIESEWLFPDKEDFTKQLKPETLNSWAVTFTNIVGKDFYWHSLRHYFTTSLARSGLPDGVIQEIVGWTSSDMVKIYKDLSTEEQLDQYFDENGIKEVKTKKLSDL